LNTLLDNYDDSLNRTLIERDLEHSQGLMDYHQHYNTLERFARANPTFDYQRLLTKGRADHIAHFYKDEILLDEETIQRRRRALMQARSDAREAEYSQYYR